MFLSQAELHELRRYMLYCKGLKQRRGELQMRFWREHLGAGECHQIVNQIRLILRVWWSLLHALHQA